MKKLTGALAVLMMAAIALLPLPAHTATMNPQENLNLYAGNKLIVDSTQPSIKSVVVRGNLTAAMVSNNAYPAKNFTITTNSTQLYTLNFLLSYQSPYTTEITIKDPSSGSSTQYTSYFVSGGDLNLTVFASFQTAPSNGPNTPLGWASFYGWVSQFGGAFPFWIKILYAVLGAQFAFVGYRWIKFEDERRRIEGHLPPLDRGNKAYLWTEVVFRTLLAGFAISLAVMIGEVLVLLIAQYLFFVNLDLVSLIDFFSIFFVAALGTLVYLTREGLDRIFDLKPIMED
ncbi:hypothetical protein E6H32_08760 [Candidatus Bathyarchaeota archaeon]|nr:MAG: hypothetical protein E6H32_08760 [Candidatus Bathyarchaeota archaeon]